MLQPAQVLSHVWLPNPGLCLQYRLTANYKDVNFVSTRVSDKVVITALMMLLYWGKGNNLATTNLLNVSTLLYMWAMLPAFSAAAYVPTLVLERPLYTRYRHCSFL